MAVEQGTRFGSYEVAEQIGAGGMGVVYRAADTKLGRDVAIKVLPPTLAEDTDRLARFRREAEVLASLNHPNIAHIYGLEDVGESTALVMELIDGPTLADRIEQGPLPPDEALDIAMQIAEGLEAAHAGGIVHRDLKPANVKIREDGLVKVLDFGIAKALDTRTNDSGFQQPALTSPTMTRAGIRVGTAAYMSPEQARGRPVDQRTDVWAFGVLLYEMLTGQPAFGSEDETSTIARVLERETDMSTLPPTLEPAVRKALRLCLVKDPRERVADIRDVRLVLKGTFDDEVAATETSPARWVAALVGVAIVASAATWFASPTPPAVEDTGSSSRVVRALVNTAPGTRLTGYALDEELAFASLQRPSRLSMALSPDGRMLAYTAREDEAEDPDLAPRLYLQRLDRDEPTAIPGTEGAVMPFFSTDGQSIGFWSPDWELKRLTIDSGDIRTVALEPDDLVGIGTMGDWNDDDTLLVAAEDGIYEVPSTGGAMTRLTEWREDERFHAHPQMLPGRSGILYTIVTPSLVPSEFQIAVQPLDGGEPRMLIDRATHATYVPTGHIVFARSGSLLAVPFDVDALELTGAPAVVIEDVMLAENAINGEFNSGTAQYTVANDGTLVSAPGGIYPDVALTSLALVDPDNQETVLLPEGMYLLPRFSPDGRRLSYVSGNPGDRQIWVYDLELEVPIRLTTEGSHGAPIWSPDGSRLAFNRGDLGSRMFTISAAGGGEPQPVGGDLNGVPMSWSADDVLIFGHTPDPQNVLPTLWTLEMDGTSEPEPFVDVFPQHVNFSPDGRWVAYVSDDTGGHEVYVRPFPAGAPVYRISNTGGESPFWSPDGTQLFYMDPRPVESEEEDEPEAAFTPDAFSLMAVDIDTSDGFERGRPEVLFTRQLANTGPVGSLDISPDGESFAILLPGVHPGLQPVTSVNIVLNWFDELRELVPVAEPEQ